jgi:4-methyl-5(b-hydroxyethyl)-thiazole monophosphate biosynthesis
VEAITPADFLDRGGVKVILAGIGGKTIKGGHGITINADCELSAAPKEIDCLVIPGGSKGAENIAASGLAIELIKETYKKGKLVAAICAAPAVVLPKTGIIKGKKVTCFPGLEDKLEGATWLEDRVVTDGNLVTSRGAGTAAEFAIKLVELLAGKTTAEKIRTSTLQP